RADIAGILGDLQSAAPAFAASSGWRRTLLVLRLNLGPVVREVGLPALLMGCTFPLANATIQRVERAVGRRAGLPYLANTVGAVGGALAVGFVLLPTLGMQASVTVLAVAGAAGVIACV